MYKISCFADEISPKLQDQIDILKSLNIHYLSLRSVDDINVLDLTDSQLDDISSKLSCAGIRVSSIGSPIGKTPIEDTSDLYLKQTEKAIRAAYKLNCPRIRVFSFYIPEGKLDYYRDEVISRLKKMTKMASDSGIELLHENERGIYGMQSKRCGDLLKSVNSPWFNAVFDPSNFVDAEEKPFDESLKNIRPYVAYLHIKDSRLSDHVIVPAGEGDAQIAEILKTFKNRNLFLTLEPHLSIAGKMRGFTGPELFVKAHKALTSILDEQKIKYQ